MRYIFNNILALTFLFGSVLQAQTNTLDFKITSNNVKISGQNSPLTSTFTKTGNTIVWTQLVNGNTNTTSFIVGNVTGNWNQETSLGVIIYNMINGDMPVTLTISGKRTETSARLSFKRSDNKTENYIFNINTIYYQ
tara:strand:+ start:345 stop:755 length:411 start_codon:yes stop_codon:yes gene_type:complete